LLARLFNASALWEFSFEGFLATDVLEIFLLLVAAIFFSGNASGALLSTGEQEIISKTKADKIAAITLFLMAWIRFQNKKMKMQ
jgi:hypothetical protein